jgi:hypothetical protein
MAPGAFRGNKVAAKDIDVKYRLQENDEKGNEGRVVDLKQCISFFFSLWALHLRKGGSLLASIKRSSEQKV